MRPSEAQKILENPEDHTVQERKDAKAVMAKVGSLGQDKTTPLKRDKGGDTPGKRKGKVPVIAISVGMAEMPKSKKNKAAMMRGGMANGKQHMYSNGGSVTDKLNPGLRALQNKRPDVVAKILKK
tara:strand:- start:18 stop:392 length:375 start_codon:yes stop_codon:yes gene_type:complete